MFYSTEFSMADLTLIVLFFKISILYKYFSYVFNAYLGSHYSLWETFVLYKIDPIESCYYQ